MSDMDDEALLAALGVEVAPTRGGSHTPQEERLLAGFEEIVKFVEEHGRAPQHGEDRDIFERMYAVRLDRLRTLTSARSLLAPADVHGLLDGTAAPVVPDQVSALDDAALLAELGLDGAPAQGDITELRHVRSYEERRAAEEIANRTPCADFLTFAPLFEQVQRQLKSGERKTIRLETRSLAEIQKGTFFIVGGQVAYVAEEMDAFTTQYDRRDMRLRVVYDNGTESEVLQRSLQRALHRDEVARLITDPAAGPLFGDTTEPNDIASGTVYVLRSQSDHPFVAEHRELVHKIGITGGSVEARISQAKTDPTYLLAGVDVVATYKLANVNRTRLENVFHRIFQDVRLDLTIRDRFGKPVQPREWFLVPLPAIDEVVDRIRDGTIGDFSYDPKTARLERRTS